MATIKAGGNASIELDGTYVDGDGMTQYRTVYELIFARPADLFPVDVTGEVLGIVDPVYPPIGITAADQANHVLALKFLINLMAYPTSTLATNYEAALVAAQQNATNGRVYLFDGSYLSHGTVPNDTDCTRVSLDFRFAIADGFESSLWSEILTARAIAGMAPRQTAR